VFGDFRAGHTREESKDDDLGSTRINRLETCERSLEGEKVFYRHGTRCRRLQEIVELHRLNTAAATRVSLICGSRRSAFKSTLWSSASFTASSTVRRSVAGVLAAVWADAVAASEPAIRVMKTVLSIQAPVKETKRDV